MSTGPRIPRFFVGFWASCVERSHVRVLQQLLGLFALTIVVGADCLPARAEEFLDATPPPDIGPASSAPPAAAALNPSDNANLEGCQVIARVDDQIVLACEVLWRVNQMLEAYQKKAGPDHQVPADQLKGVRQQLMQKEVASMVDRKLLYIQFRH